MTYEEKQIHNAVHVKLQEFDDFISLVKKMRKAQKRIDNLAGGEDIEFVDMLYIEQREAEREVDEYLKKMENQYEKTNKTMP